MTGLVLVLPADLEAPTGGNRYDQSLAGALHQLGVPVQQRLGPGRWPVATSADRGRLSALLRSGGADGEQPDGVPVLVDGLLAGGAPEAVVSAIEAGVRLHVLVHLPLALETGLSVQDAAELEALERQALRAATGVITTSHWAAADLRARHGLERVAVAAPGTDPAPPSTGSTPPRLLQLATVTPRKDQLGVLEALSQIQDLPWTADLTGRLDVDAGYTEQVRAAIDRHRLGDRVGLTGPAGGDRLAAAWAAADLLLLPSHAETWGLVVTEALARGVPVVVGRGTGAQEALGQAPGGAPDKALPGAVIRPGHPVALAGAIRHLLGPGRASAVAAASARGRTLRRWLDTARDVLAAVQ